MSQLGSDCYRLGSVRQLGIQVRQAVRQLGSLNSDNSVFFCLEQLNIKIIKYCGSTKVVNLAKAIVKEGVSDTRYRQADVFVRLCRAVATARAVFGRRRPLTDYQLRALMRLVKAGKD